MLCATHFECHFGCIHLRSNCDVEILAVNSLYMIRDDCRRVLLDAKEISQGLIFNSCPNKYSGINEVQWHS